MKRSRLQRRSGLSADPDRVQAWLRRSRRRLPARSAKREAEQPTRNAVRAAVLARGGFRCAAAALVPHVGCGGPLDVHEPHTRARGGSYLDAANAVALCRAHHDWTHAHPAQAEALGLLEPSRR